MYHDTPLEPLQIQNPRLARTARFHACRFPSSSLRTAAVGSLSGASHPHLARSPSGVKGFRPVDDLLFADSKSRQKGFSNNMLEWLFCDKAEN